MARPRNINRNVISARVSSATLAAVDYFAAVDRKDLTRSGAVELLLAAGFDATRAALRVGESAVLCRLDGTVEFRVCLPGAAHSWLTAFGTLAQHVKDSLAKHGGLYEVK